MNCIVRGGFRNERNINEREWGEKRKKYTTSKGRSRHADFRGAIDHENVKKKRGRGRKGSFATKNSTTTPNGTTRSGLLPSPHFTFWNRPIFRAFLPYTTPLPSSSFSCFFSTRNLYLLLASPPFRGGTFVKEGLPLFRERTPPLIFRDDRSVAAFLIVQHWILQWILSFRSCVIHGATVIFFEKIRVARVDICIRNCI